MIQTWNEAVAKARSLAARTAKLQGRLEAGGAEHARQMNALTEAQQRVQAGDFVREILDDLQHKEHERAVGAYEQLLGAFLSDVLPGERKIVMDLHADRGAPALDIFVRKGDDLPLEDAWLGTGGSVTNLLSTGLRLVALLRSGQRRFLVLDESDCWIKPDLIPKYASIVAQMSRELNVQVLMISHHDESLFAQHIPHRLRMSRLKGGLLAAEWSGSSDIPQWDTAEEGLRCIELKNFQSHQHTFIPLSPNVTLLQGDNDIGKSAVVNALRAVFEGDSNDTMIKHHATGAQISIDMGPEHLLTWQRFRKGKIKVSYKLLDTATQESIHASDGTKVPDWLREHVKIGQVDGLDIQIGQQQQPVFLLNQTASTRAKALAIGQESGHVNAMMLLDRQEMQDAKAVVKSCEKSLEYLRRQLDVLTPMGQHKWMCQNDDLLAHTVHAHQNMSDMRTLVQRWQGWVVRVETLRFAHDVSLPAVPVPKHPVLLELLTAWRGTQERCFVLDILSEQEDLLRHVPRPSHSPWNILAQNWRQADGRIEALKELETTQQTVAVPVEMAGHVHSLHQKWRRAHNLVALLDTVADAAASTFPLLHTSFIGQSHGVRQRWMQANTIEKEAEMELMHLEETMKEIHHERQEMFSVCPTCHQQWPA